MERDYSYAVLIGRFQPFHNNHRQLIEHGFEIADNVIVLVGSAFSARDPRNPFTYDERRNMIEGAFPATEQISDTYHKSTPYSNRLHVRPIRDFFEHDPIWTAQVQSVTSEFIRDGDSVALLGAFKDASSYYLKLFPQWDNVTDSRILPDPDQSPTLSASEVRETFFDVNYSKDWESKPTFKAGVVESQDAWLDQNVPKPTFEFLSRFRRTPEWLQLADAFHAIKSDKKKWAGSPHPPVFVTADAVVTCSGHVLVITRKRNPGKGLYALPGGFIKQHERVRAAALRELKEETRIRVHKLILDSNIVDEHVFDYPERSLRGRTITHAFHIKLKDGTLPEVTAGDDAETALWMPLMDVNRYGDQFFEDHIHIIGHFI